MVQFMLLIAINNNIKVECYIFPYPIKFESLIKITNLFHRFFGFPRVESRCAAF